MSERCDKATAAERYLMWPRVSTLYLQHAVSGCNGGVAGVHVAGVHVAGVHSLDNERHVGGQGQSDLAGKRRRAGEEVQVPAAA